MKKYLSVCMLIVRSSIYPVVGVLAGTLIGNGVLFFLTGWQRADLYEASLTFPPCSPACPC